MAKFSKCLQNVAVHYYQDHFLIASTSQLPPIYASTIIPPLYTSTKDDVDQLTKAIEQARLNSKTKEQLAGADLTPREFTKEENRAMDNATKNWTISWDEDGDVNLTIWEPWPQKGTDKSQSWRPKRFGTILLQKPVRTNEIAEWLIEQIK